MSALEQQAVKPLLKVARVYLRVSTDEQDTQRQERLVKEARANGFYIAGVYREAAAGARADRPELMRMIDDLQPGEVVVTERIDRISRLPLPEAERLVAAIRDKGANLAIPGVVDLSEVIAQSTGQSRIVLEAMQELLLRLALQLAREDYEDRRERQRQGIELAKRQKKYKGRKADTLAHERIIEYRKACKSIAETARLTNCSETQVKRVWRAYRERHPEQAN